MADENTIAQMNCSVKKLGDILEECIIIDKEKLRKHDKEELEQVVARYEEFKGEPGYNPKLAYTFKKLLSLY